MHLKNIVIVSAVVLLVAGCKKMNNGPQEFYTEEYVFDPLDKNGLAAQQALAGLYTNMPTGFNRIGGDVLETATDDAIPSRNGTTIQLLINSNITNSNNPEAAWTRNYEGIRKANLFMRNVGVVPKPAEVIIWKAEARFLRAYFYFELLKRYGGVPIVGDTVFNTTDKIQLKRNTFEQCVNYIVAECDAIKGLLRAEPIASNDFGKASRGAALALKARTLLYAASPLYNGGVPAGASGDQRELMGYAAYDAERWNKAAVAANDLLTLNVYPLEATYNNVFINRRNNEVILSYLRGTTTDVETNNGPVGYSEGGTGYGQTSPTQDLVNAFGMNNGKFINEAGSTYNPAAPYANRDPRLGLTVFTNGAQWLNRAVQTYEGGLDKPGFNAQQTRTGYYMRKFMGNFSTATAYTAQNHNFVLFRSAEVMLNYAEALNEYSGPVQLVYNQLVNLRKRAGIAAGADARYGLSATLTKDSMRIVIRNERRVEMAFEEQRYWDLRRWKTAEQELNKDLGGMKITNNNGVFTYQPVTAGSIVFTAPKMYFYPIPHDEMTKNPLLIQNYGW
jgi:hypothetical protein